MRWLATQSKSRQLNWFLSGSCQLCQVGVTCKKEPPCKRVHVRPARPCSNRNCSNGSSHIDRLHMHAFHAQNRARGSYRIQAQPQQQRPPLPLSPCHLWQQRPQQQPQQLWTQQHDKQQQQQPHSDRAPITTKFFLTPGQDPAAVAAKAMSNFARTQIQQHLLLRPTATHNTCFQHCCRQRGCPAICNVRERHGQQQTRHQQEGKPTNCPQQPQDNPSYPFHGICWCAASPRALHLAPIAESPRQQPQCVISLAQGLVEYELPFIPAGTAAAAAAAVPTAVATGTQHEAMHPSAAVTDTTSSVVLLSLPLAAPSSSNALEARHQGPIATGTADTH